MENLEELIINRLIMITKGLETNVIDFEIAKELITNDFIIWETYNNKD